MSRAMREALFDTIIASLKRDSRLGQLARAICLCFAARKLFRIASGTVITKEPMSSRIQREMQFDTIFSRLKRDGRLKELAHAINVSNNVVEMWETERPSGEVQLEVIYWAMESSL